MSFIRIGNSLIKLDAVREIVRMEESIYISYNCIEPRDALERYIRFSDTEQVKQEFENISRILGCKYQLDNLSSQPSSQLSSQPSSQPYSQPSSQPSSQQPSS